MRQCLTLFLSLFFSLHFFKCKIAKSGSKSTCYFPCKSHVNLLKREVITLFLFAICLWWMLLFPFSPPGYNLSLKPKLENSKDELLKKVWIFTLHVLLIRKEKRTMCNEKSHRDIYITANMPPIEDIVTWTVNPRQKSLKHLLNARPFSSANVEMWLQSYLATTTWRAKTKGSSFSKLFKVFFVWDCSLVPVTSTSLLWLMISGSASGLVTGSSQDFKGFLFATYMEPARLCSKHFCATSS